MGYWRSLGSGFETAWGGLLTTLRHVRRAGKGKKQQSIRAEGYFGDDGIVTVYYPDEKILVPPLGRYKLDVEIDDCIVCDKCARVCPVDCIDIEAVKSPAVWGQTSDGTGKRLYAAKFDIDMAKCCFCGLCTTVCPTDCIVMTTEYDYPTLNLAAFDFAFATLSPEEADLKRSEYDQFVAEKAAAKKSA
jgi:NADH-quinone oxidoreductase subunit I